MTPEEHREDISQRVRALEARMSEVQQEQAASRSEQAAARREIADLRQLVQTLVPIGERTAVLVEHSGQLERDISRVESKFDKRWERLEQSQVDARKDSRGLRNLLIGVGCAAVLSPIGGIVVAIIVGKP